MSNVVPLFKQETIDNPSDDPSKSVKIAIADILASCIRLSHTVKDLSKHFGAVDHVIDGLGDAESKSRLDQLMKQTSKALAAAMHELSQAIKNCLGYRSTPWRTLQGKVTAAMVSEARCIACNARGS